MKTIVTLFCLLLTASPLFAQKTLTPISEHVYSYVDVKEATPANSFGANAGIIIGEKGIAVVDTLISAKQAQKFLTEIKSLTDKPILYVINTHSHLDHTFGNCVFAAIGSTIIAQAADDASMRENSESALANAEEFGLTKEDLEGTTISYPDISFTENLNIDLGNLLIKLLYQNPSHSKGSIVVSVPADNLIFAGDILFTDFHPYLADSDIGGWQLALDFIKSLQPEKIIPGHGPLSTLKDVDDLQQYLVNFDQKAKRLAQTNQDIDTIAAIMKKELPQRSNGEWIIKANLQAKYLTAKPEKQY